MPQRKTRCPACQRYVYSRTRPIDAQKVLLREEDLDRLNEEWSIANGTHDEFLQQRARRVSAEEELRRELTRQPTPEEVQLRLLLEDAAILARQQNWGLYRNARFSIGEVLRAQGSFEAALRLFLEVCYIDLSGPQNVAGIPDSFRTGGRFPDFDERSALVAPGVADRCRKLGVKLGLDSDGMRETFLSVAAEVDRHLTLPVEASVSWDRLKGDLELE